MYKRLSMGSYTPDSTYTCANMNYSKKLKVHRDKTNHGKASLDDFAWVEVWRRNNCPYRTTELILNAYLKQPSTEYKPAASYILSNSIRPELKANRVRGYRDGERRCTWSVHNQCRADRLTATASRMLSGATQGDSSGVGAV